MNQVRKLSQNASSQISGGCTPAGLSSLRGLNCAIDILLASNRDVGDEEICSGVLFLRLIVVLSSMMFHAPLT